ncbi:MAG: AAA family ATPase [Parvibaculum sp.]|nr:AAA family ATPase [Parvibaculum sp.]
MKVDNFRSLECMSLEFPGFYTAICGKNDAGKTNIVRVLQGLMKNEEPYEIRTESEFNVKDDYPKWKDADLKDRVIRLNVELSVNSISDEGLFEFLTTYLSISNPEREIIVGLEYAYGGDATVPQIVARVSDVEVEGIKAQEVLKRIQTSSTILFYNSTSPSFRFGLGRFGGLFSEISATYSQEIDQATKTINSKLKNIAKGQQKHLTDLLGRLEGKYKAGLSIPSYDFDYLPFSLRLSDGKVDAEINDWGSGTRNRTHILMTLFRARQISEAPTSAAKVTPIIIIEEPESFLHPSAQAEFGRVVQDLAEEFKVQVIVTTHNPYFLSQSNPSANVLLERKTERGQLRETHRVDTTHENWMEPFGIALGISSEELRPWHDLFFKRAQSILMVEGESDKKIFEWLQDPAHGDKRLVGCSEIFAYGGKSQLQNTMLLRFIKGRYAKTFITFDLDAEKDVSKSLSAIGLEHRKDFLPIGIDAPGKRDIEGLIPAEIRQIVYNEHPELVDQLRSDKKEEKDAAKNLIKKHLASKFLEISKPGSEHCEEFYKVVKAINRSIS